MQPREPSGPIQRAPEGLLSFFGIKGVGQNPNALDSSVQSGFDIEKWFLARTPLLMSNRLSPIPASKYTNGCNSLGLVTAPPLGTVRYVRNVTVTLSVAMPDEVIDLGITRANSVNSVSGSANDPLFDITTHCSPGLPYQDQTPGATQVAFWASCQNPFLLLPGGVVGFRSNANITIAGVAAVELGIEYFDFLL